MRAAVNANCLAAQSPEAYWDFADYIHANQLAVSSEKDLNGKFGLLDQITMTEATKFVLNRNQLQSCVSAQNDQPVQQSIKGGESLGVAATPTIFVNGEMMNGAQPASEFRAAFDRALHDANAEFQNMPPSSTASLASGETTIGGAAVP
jgi:protein-disulfide isomerase